MYFIKEIHLKKLVRMEHKNDELVEALKMKIEALEMKNEAYLIKIEAMDYKINALQYKLNYDSQADQPHVSQRSRDMDVDDDHEAQRIGKKRGRKPKLRPDDIQNMQDPLYNEIERMLTGQGFNRATYRALTGILLCLYENKTATVSSLHEYIGGSRVTIVRHTSLLKKLGYVKYEGSRKKGNYVLTEQGKAFLSSLR